MANKQRGEVDVTLGGGIYTMRPTFQALCLIEDKTSCSILTLVERLCDEGSLKISEVAAIIFEAIKAGGDKTISYNEIGRVITEEGIINFIPIISEFLQLALGGAGSEENIEE